MRMIDAAVSARRRCGCAATTSCVSCCIPGRLLTTTDYCDYYRQLIINLTTTSHSSKQLRCSVVVTCMTCLKRRLHLRYSAGEPPFCLFLLSLTQPPDSAPVMHQLHYVKPSAKTPVIPASEASLLSGPHERSQSPLHLRLCVVDRRRAKRQQLRVSVQHPSKSNRVESNFKWHLV
jgi:hypothetical protein